jgi:hypothetical protein
MSDAVRLIPSYAAIAGSYGPDIAPYNTGQGGAVALPSARRVMGGGDYVPWLELDSRHCQFHAPDADGNDRQCGSWPVKKVENPAGYCAGHMKKAANGVGPPADQGPGTDES